MTWVAGRRPAHDDGRRPRPSSRPAPRAWARLAADGGPPIVEIVPRASQSWLGGGDPLRWQALAGFSFRQTGGYFIGGSATDPVLYEGDRRGVPAGHRRRRARGRGRRAGRPRGAAGERDRGRARGDREPDAALQLGTGRGRRPRTGRGRGLDRAVLPRGSLRGSVSPSPTTVRDSIDPVTGYRGEGDELGRRRSSAHDHGRRGHRSQGLARRERPGHRPDLLLPLRVGSDQRRPGRRRGPRRARAGGSAWSRASTSPRCRRTRRSTASASSAPRCSRRSARGRSASTSPAWRCARCAARASRTCTCR